MFAISSVQKKRVSCLSRIIFFIRSEAGCVTERPTVAVFALSAKISCQPYETVLYVLCARVCIPVCSIMFVFPSYDRVGSTTIVDSTKSDTSRQTTLVHVAF
ncbi:hypothetical protein HCH54_002529 [Aspergillus fumigatus]